MIVDQLIAWLENAWRYCAEAVGFVISMPGPAIVGVLILIGVPVVAILLTYWSFNAAFPKGGNRVNDIRVVKSRNASKDATVSLYGSLIEAFSSGQPGKLTFSTGPLQRVTVRARVYKRWKDWDPQVVELDPDTFLRVCGSSEVESCQFDKLRIAKDGSLWSHPSLEIRYSVRLTVIFFIISVAASVLIELTVP